MLLSFRIGTLTAFTGNTCVLLQLLLCFPAAQVEQEPEYSFISGKLLPSAVEHGRDVEQGGGVEQLDYNVQ